MPELWMPDIAVEQTMAKGYTDVVNMRPIAIINHIMQGYQGTMRTWAKERPWTTPKSAHFTIGRNGFIAQHAPLNIPTWTSGNVDEPTWKLLKYDSPGNVRNPNKYVINIEHEGFSVDPVDYGYDYLYMEWPEAMVRASIEVNAFVCSQYNIVPSVDTIIGHYQTNSVTRLDDPGKAWPKERIIQSVKKVLANKEKPSEITKNQAYWAVFRQGTTPVRIEGNWGIYEIRRRI